MTIVEAVATFLIGLLSGGLSVLAGGGVTVVLPVLLAGGLSADEANATSRFNLTVGTLIATIMLRGCRQGELGGRRLSHGRHSHQFLCRNTSGCGFEAASLPLDGC